MHISIKLHIGVKNKCYYFNQSGYVSEDRNPVPQRYRSEHSMRMRQLFFVGYYFHSNMAAEHVVVTLTFQLKVEDALDSFEEVQTKIKEIEDRTTVWHYK